MKHLTEQRSYFKTLELFIIHLQSTNMYYTSFAVTVVTYGSVLVTAEYKYFLLVSCFTEIRQCFLQISAETMDVIQVIFIWRFNATYYLTLHIYYLFLILLLYKCVGSAPEACLKKLFPKKLKRNMASSVLTIMTINHTIIFRIFKRCKPKCSKSILMYVQISYGQ